MTPNNTADQIERYLLRFRLALTGVRDKDREEVVAEIRSHIVERLEDTSHPVDEVVQQTLAGLGSPELLATRYHTEGLLERASASMSPWLLLRATMRWAMTGIRGFIAFWVLFIGYSTAATFYLCAFLKPIFPDNIGLWFNPETREFNMGYHGPGSPPAQRTAWVLAVPRRPVVRLPLHHWNHQARALDDLSPSPWRVGSVSDLETAR